MTPQESTLSNDLVSKIQQTQLAEKDDEAERFLQDSLGRNPDSLYILAQTVLVQNIAVDQAKVQIQQLQQQLQQAQSQAQVPQPVHATSFLGSLLGRHDLAPPSQPAQSFPPRPAAAPQYYPPPPAYAPDYAAAPPAAPQGGSSSFLRSAATTAAGVAAGALAFEGVESILHGFGHGGGGFGGGFGGGGFGGGGFGERPVEETVVNNYYDDPNRGGENREREASFDDRSGDRFGNDQGAQLHDASYNTGGDDLSSRDDTLDDDQNSGMDDSSNFDDSGSFDDGGGDDSSLV